MYWQRHKNAATSKLTYTQKHGAYLNNCLETTPAQSVDRKSWGTDWCSCFKRHMAG